MGGSKKVINVSNKWRKWSLQERRKSEWNKGRGMSTAGPQGTMAQAMSFSVTQTM